MLFRLCQQWGEPFIHPDILQAVMPEQWLNDWTTFYEIEPWGCMPDDYRAALTAWLLFNEKMQGRCQPKDLVPKWGGKDAMTSQEYKEKAMAVHARAAARLKG